MGWAPYKVAVTAIRREAVSCPAPLCSAQSLVYPLYTAAEESVGAQVVPWRLTATALRRLSSSTQLLYAVLNLLCARSIEAAEESVIAPGGAVEAGTRWQEAGPNREERRLSSSTGLL